MYLHVKDIPLEITRYGNPIFWVVGVPPKEAPKKKEPVVQEFSPAFCEISEANENVSCTRLPLAKFRIRYTGGEEPATWELWLCEAHSSFKGNDIEVTKITD